MLPLQLTCYKLPLQDMIALSCTSKLNTKLLDDCSLLLNKLTLVEEVKFLCGYTNKQLFYLLLLSNDYIGYSDCLRKMNLKYSHSTRFQYSWILSLFLRTTDREDIWDNPPNLYMIEASRKTGLDSVWGMESMIVRYYRYCLSRNIWNEYPDIKLYDYEILKYHKVMNKYMFVKAMNNDDLEYAAKIVIYKNKNYLLNRPFYEDTYKQLISLYSYGISIEMIAEVKCDFPEMIRFCMNKGYKYNLDILQTLVDLAVRTYMYLLDNESCNAEINECVEDLLWLINTLSTDEVTLPICENLIIMNKILDDGFEISNPIYVIEDYGICFDFSKFRPDEFTEILEIFYIHGELEKIRFNSNYFSYGVSCNLASSIKTMSILDVYISYFCIDMNRYQVLEHCRNKHGEIEQTI